MESPAPDMKGADVSPEPVPALGSESQPSAADGVIWAVLRNCYDPEIPLNIVDLGLVYGVSVRGARVDIRMTLTAPGCPMAGQMAEDVQNKLLALDPVEEVNVELVWDPPWNQSMMTEAGKLELGLM